MRIAYKLVGILFVVLLTTGLISQSIAGTSKPAAGKDNQKSSGCEKNCASMGGKTSEAGCGMSCGDDCGTKLCSDKVDETMDQYPSWVLSSQNETYISQPLIEFRLINGRYPKDVAEFINSGLLLAWPADPATGKPLKLVKKLTATKEDTGKIAYVRESDNKAGFEIVVKNAGKYQIYKFPCCKTVESAMGEGKQRVENTEWIRKDSFERCMGGIFSAALSRPEYLKGQKTPSGLSDALSGNFFLIKENLKPSFISADPNKPVYFEKGLATLDGKPVTFEESTITMKDEYGKEMLDHFFWISTIKPSDEEWVKDQAAWNRLQNKIYFYSTKLIASGGMKYPTDVLISKDQILKG